MGLPNFTQYKPNNLAIYSYFQTTFAMNKKTNKLVNQDTETNSQHLYSNKKSLFRMRQDESARGLYARF